MRSARVTALAYKPVRALQGGIQCLCLTQGHQIFARPEPTTLKQTYLDTNSALNQVPSRPLIPHPIRRLKKRLQQHILLVFFQPQILHRHQHTRQPLIARRGPYRER